jgi:hypothetical protein
LGLGVSLLLVACSTTTVTQPPTSSPAPSKTAASTPTKTAKPSLTPIIEPSRSAGASASGSADASSSASASAMPGGACTGTDEQKAFFAEAALKLKFDVYCASLPGGWWFQDGQFQEPNGGQITVLYKNNAGSTIRLSEGNWCSADPASCWATASTIGPASYGPLSGTMYVVDSSGTLGIYINPSTTHGYSIKGTSLTQSKFTAIAAALVKVEKQ